MLKSISAVCAGALTILAASAVSPARAAEVVFLSTQLRPIEEAQKMRDLILKGAPDQITYVTEEPAKLNIRVKAEMEAGKRSFSLIGALHGELAGLPDGALDDISDLAPKLAARGVPQAMIDLGKLGGGKLLYAPWMQATYVMAANREALKHLPAGADINALSYEQLAQWAEAVRKATGERKLGFPAGPKGLMARFFEGYLYPSYTGGVVSTFRSADAEAAWVAFKALWANVNPASTSYDFMQEPLLSGEVWIAWDHIARLMDALKQKPDQFIVFPAPAGPKGRGFMPVIAGLSIPKGAPDRAGGERVIDWLTQSRSQVNMALQLGFFPVVKADLPADLPAGVKLAVAGIAAQSGAKDGVVSLLPIGLGAKGGEFNKVYTDTFQRIVLRNEPARAVLDHQAEALRALMKETGAPCWAPDKASAGACPVN